MFRQAGFTKGELDGQEDAMKGQRYRPRPDLALSILSSGYQDGYAAAYLKAYQDTKRAILQQQLRDNRQQNDNYTALVQMGGIQKSMPFDQGWKHGFVGKAMYNSHFTNPSDISAYNRGYKLGARDRDFARAKALREQMTRGHDGPEPQVDSEREL